MANRKGVFIGAYVPNQLKEALQQRAKAEHRTLSQEITHFGGGQGRRLPPGFVTRAKLRLAPAPAINCLAPRRGFANARRGAGGDD